MIDVYHWQHATTLDAQRFERDHADISFKLRLVDAPGAVETLLTERVKGAPELVMVASLQTDSLSEAFEKTNHINSNWAHNDGLTLADGQSPLCLRSTSVGDVLRDVQTGRWMVVASVGFEELSEAASAVLNNTILGERQSSRLRPNAFRP